MAISKSKSKEDFTSSKQPSLRTLARHVSGSNTQLYFRDPETGEMSEANPGDEIPLGAKLLRKVHRMARLDSKISNIVSNAKNADRSSSQNPLMNDLEFNEDSLARVSKGQISSQTLKHAFTVKNV